MLTIAGGIVLAVLALLFFPLLLRGAAFGALGACVLAVIVLAWLAG